MGANFFPISFTSHITFCIIAIIFFLIQYIRLRYTYQLLTIVAIAGTLLLYLNDSSIFFYSVGVFELIMIILIGIFIAKQRKKQDTQEKEANKVTSPEPPQE